MRKSKVSGVVAGAGVRMPQSVVPGREVKKYPLKGG